MKTLILYYSKYGTTQKCAQKLAESITGGADVVDYKGRKSVNLDDYDTVIIGAPVYMGMLKKMKGYCEANLDKLLTKKMGLFVCHMDDKTPMDDKIGGYFPQQLIDHATAIKGFGGAYDTENMGKFDRFIFEKVAKETGPSDKVDYSAIEDFAQAMG